MDKVRGIHIAGAVILLGLVALIMALTVVVIKTTAEVGQAVAGTTAPGDATQATDRRPLMEISAIYPDVVYGGRLIITIDYYDGYLQRQAFFYDWAVVRAFLAEREKTHRVLWITSDRAGIDEIEEVGNVESE